MGTGVKKDAQRLKNRIAKFNRLYWFCQVAGWGGMVSIEVINYTFFIVGEFNTDFVTSFLMQASSGLIVTHLYKKVLDRLGIFNRPTSTIWLIALASTFFLSLILLVITTIPALIKNYDAVKDSIGFIVIFGSVVNWMRYVGVWVIIYFMYHLLARNQAIEREKLISQNAASIAELELLRTQLNPHFLFNALNSIKALVTIDPEKSKDAIVKLSELLRFTLSYSQQPLIPLHDELLEVKKYLALEQIRFGDRLKVEYDISDSSLTRMIPPALLLTLAENAIKHGIAAHAMPGKIILKAFLNRDMLTIEMTNTGHLAAVSTDGIGLRNTRMRLKTLFGSNSSFSIAEVNAQVIVTITIKAV